MSIDNLYKLREDFVLLGLTGRMGGGCDDIATKLSSSDNPFRSVTIPEKLHINEKQKFRICKDLVCDEHNAWQKFDVIKYKNVLLLFFLSELVTVTKNDLDSINLEILTEMFLNIFDRTTVKAPRIGQEDKTDYIIEKVIFPYLTDNLEKLRRFGETFKLQNSKIEIDNIEDSCGDNPVKTKEFNHLFFNEYLSFCNDLFDRMDKVSPVARQIFLQDIACNIRSNGTIYCNNNTSDSKHIYDVALIIKQIIKINKKESGESGKCKLIIDSLKNSLEINYFRERYSGFYLISSNREYNEVDIYLTEKIKDLEAFEDDAIHDIVRNLRKLDDAHYKITEFKKGDFTAPDLENCIQKADYYIFRKEEVEEPIEGFQYYSFDMQLLKLIALINKPGLITPNAMERNMQLAFSSKYNSGCISRQVGAVVTDEFYSVKAIGWNEVPQGQTPCSLRSITDLIEGENGEIFTEYEKNDGDYHGITFKNKVSELVAAKGSVKDLKDTMKGHNCPFCFKEYHNTFQGKDNQVHTRSLHAEENAMMQISKYGGQALKNGNLFTTASPCELCSKKACQLGIVNIFYIDPYPGIAQSQILKGGKKPPNLFMFQGAVGRGYFKLFEPYMSLKDETSLRSKISPTVPVKEKASQFKALLGDYKQEPELKAYLDIYKDDPEIISKVVDLIKDRMKVEIRERGELQ